MNTTWHLFRNDVRRLRWWLVGWAAFLVGTHWWVSATLWTERFRNDDWLFNVVRSETVFYVAWLALLTTLTALLLLPHAAEGTRLFWRTRPITARDVVRAKFLFAGLFLIALPMAVETVFWRAWVPWGRVAEHWPGMLQERVGWAALLVLVVALGGREGKHYAYCLLGLLLGFFGWMTFGEQLAMRTWSTTGEEGIWPLLDSPHLLGQLWQFWSKNSPGRIMSMTHTTAMVLFITFAVAAWVVVACRYLWAGWRATRLAIEGAMLLALVIAFGLSEKGQSQKSNEHVVARLEGPLSKELARTEMRLKEARLVLQREFLGREPRVDDPAATKRGAVFAWEPKGKHPGAVLLWRTAWVGSDTPNHTFGGSDRGLVFYTREMPYYVEQAGEQLAAVLPELSGYAVRSKRVESYHWVELQATWADEFSRAGKPAKASVEVGALIPKTLTVLPLDQHRTITLGQCRISVLGGSEPRLKFTLPSLQIQTWLWDPRQSESTPNLFVIRNAKTKEAIIAGRFACEDTWGLIVAPASTRQLDLYRAECSLAQVTARYGLSAAWLEGAELLCVRMQLAGHVHRQLRLENFRLEPAPGQ